MITTEKDIEESQQRTPANAPSLVLAALAIIGRTRANWREVPAGAANGHASATRERVAEKRSAIR